jgi:hypothetical protein
MCRPIHSTIVISEEVEDFVDRNLNSARSKQLSDIFGMLQWKPTSEAHYGKLKKNNPGSDSYFKLKKEDYGYIDNYCRDCVHEDKCPADHLDEDVECPQGYEYEDKHL